MWSAPQLGLQDDLTRSVLVPQNALPSDLLENALCGVAFGLGVLGTVLGIVFFVCSQRPCSGGKSLGKVREPDKSASVRAPGFFSRSGGLYAAGSGCVLVSGDPVTDTVIGERRNSLEQGMR